MSFFDDPKNVGEYIQMADGYDGRELIEVLERHLPDGKSVLELGMGPGKDLDMLALRYDVTGSDSSKVFLDLYRDSHPDVNLVQLDAVTMDIEKSFDCIYSNKVLHHLAKAELVQSFQMQREKLFDDGLLMHSFWFGDKEEEIQGLRFVYYTRESLLDCIGDGYEIVELEMYTEFEENDSFYIVLRKTDSE